MEFNIIYYPELSDTEKKSLIEALIFASDEPLTPENLLKLLIKDQSNNELDLFDNGEEDIEESIKKNKKLKVAAGKKLVQEHLELIDDFQVFVKEINEDLAATGRPFRIVDYGGGWQFGTIKKYGELVNQVHKNKSKKRLSQASLESLAIIAYKQPVSKPEIEQIRGVNSNEVVNSLLEKGFVKISGRSDAPGKPLLYSTTQEFLITFGLNSINDLPKLKELDELTGIPAPVSNHDNYTNGHNFDNKNNLNNVNTVGTFNSYEKNNDFDETLNNGIDITKNN